MLHELIILAQNGNKKASTTLVDKFSPIINRYSRLLHNEDAQQELYLFFLELLIKIPSTILIAGNEGKIVNYISSAIKNHYNLLVKNLLITKNTFPLSSFSIEKQNDIECSLYCMDEYIQESMELLKKTLTKNELDIIILHIFLQYSIQEIAYLKSISRQAVNQMYNRAIKKLNAFY